MRHRGPAFVFNVVGLTAAVGLVLIALSTREAEARACYSRLPSAAERTGHWSYSVKRGRKCWSGPLKKGAATTSFDRTRLRYAARKGSPEPPAVGRLEEPDEADVWPPLERVPDDFEARWQGEK